MQKRGKSMAAQPGKTFSASHVQLVAFGAIGLLLLLGLASLFYIFLAGQQASISFSPENRCTDGTLDGRCSLSGLYCSQGRLVQDCSVCGCTRGQSELRKINDVYTPTYSRAGDFESGDANGYIIEFKMQPYYRNPGRNAGYKNSLLAEHSRAKQGIEAQLGKKIGQDVRVYGEFFDSFNGLALDISEAECSQLKERLSDVKECYPNLEVRVLLDKALPVTGVDGAPALGYTGEGVVIAVIDTGIDPEHESLDDMDDDSSTDDQKVIAFKDFVNFRTEAYDDHGHGTHVSGIAAGTGGAEGKFKGVAPGAKLVGVKVLNSWGGGTFAGVVMGMEWAVQNKERYGIDIISMSLGANYNGDGTTPVEIAATTAMQLGVNMVVAAGNAGPRENSVGIPASAKDIITVGAIDNNKEIAAFSSRGPTKDGRIKPEVTAPGVRITAPDANSGDGYVSFSGTSMATPYVSGIVALLKQANSSLNTSDMRSLLMNTAEDRGETGPDNTYGWGIVDPMKALTLLNKYEKEITVKRIDSELVYDVGRPITINAVIKNYGSEDVGNINVRFFVEGEEKGTRNVNIGADSEASAEFTFAANEEGTYDIKVEVDAVEGEASSLNNFRRKGIVVRDYVDSVKAVVLDSWGTQYAQYTIFEDLNNEWFVYGNYLVEIDYKSMHNQEITYDLLQQSGADVLIISDAWQDGGYIQGANWEFSDSEIEAIKRYVGEGHGLIITSGTLSTNSPGNVENNMKLAPVVGIDENSEPIWSGRIESNFKVFYPLHDLFEKIGGSYITENFNSVISLELNDDNIRELLAQSEDGEGIVVSSQYGEGNTIYFSHIIELYYADYADKQVFYNALLWTAQDSEERNNAIKVRVEDFPSIVGKDQEFLATLSVENKGSERLENLQLTYEINGNVAGNVVIDELNASSVLNVSLPITLDDYGLFVLVAGVDAVNGENVIYDNYVTSEFLVPSVRLTGNVLEETLDEDGNGRVEALNISVEVEVFEEGEYSLRGILKSGFGAEFFGYDIYSFSEPAGTYYVSFYYPTVSLRLFGLNGPYTLGDFVLTQQVERSLSESEREISGEEIDIEERVVASGEILYNTAEYNAENDFDSYPDLTVYSESVDEQVIVNKSFIAEIEIANVGTETSTGFTINVYRIEYEGSKSSGTNSQDESSGPNITFIKSLHVDESLAIFERELVEIELNESEQGYKDYLAEIIGDELDKNSANNNYTFNARVVEEESDLRGSFEKSEEVLIKDKLAKINVIIENEGVKPATNASVKIYVQSSLEHPEELEEISIIYLGDIDVRREVKAEFNYTPTAFGNLVFIGNITSDNDFDASNNEFSNSFEVVPDAPDVKPEFYIYNIGNDDSGGNFLVGRGTRINIFMDNIGTKKAEQVTANAYLLNESDEILIGSVQFGNINSGSSLMKEISWTPTRAGRNEIIVRASAKEDGNLENNEDNYFAYVELDSPRLYSYISSPRNSIPANESFNVTLLLSNDGVRDAENVKLELYAKLWEVERFIGNASFEKIDASNRNDQSVTFEINPASLCFNDLVDLTYGVVPGSPVQINVSWQSESGEDYYLQETTDLINWNDVSYYSGNGDVISYYADLIGPNKFYRVLTSPGGCVPDNERNYLEFKINWSVENGVDEYRYGENHDSRRISNSPELYIYSYYSSPRAFANNDTVLDFAIQNDGIKKAENVNLNLYLADNMEFLNAELHDSVSVGDVSPRTQDSNDEMQRYSLTLKGREAGKYYLKVNASYDGQTEERSFTTEFLFTGNGPDIEVYPRIHDVSDEDFVVNKTIMIPVELRNSGNANSGIISLALHEQYETEQGYGESVLSGSVVISSLASGEETRVEVPFTPRVQGFYQLMFNASTDGEILLQNNIESRGVQIASASADVSGKIVVNSPYAVAGEESKFDIEVKNLAKVDAEDVTVRVYAYNESYISSSSILLGDNLWLYYNQIGSSTLFHDWISFRDRFTGESYNFSFNVNEDTTDGRNETTIKNEITKDTYEGKFVGSSFSIGNLNFDISEIGKNLTDEWVIISVPERWLVDYKFDEGALKFSLGEASFKANFLVSGTVTEIEPVDFISIKDSFGNELKGMVDCSFIGGVNSVPRISYTLYCNNLGYDIYNITVGAEGYKERSFLMNLVSLQGLSNQIVYTSVGLVPDLSADIGKTLIYSTIIDSIERRRTAYIQGITWIPENAGTHRLELEVGVEGDENTANNLFAVPVNAYARKNAVFNLHNASGSFMSRYVSVNGNRQFVTSSNKNVEFVDSDSVRIGINSIHYTDSGLFDALVEFSNSHVSGNSVNITSEVYLNASNGSIIFDRIYANQPDWSYQSLDYAFVYTENERALNRAEVYACEDWNFENIKCNSAWKKLIPDYAFAGREGIYVFGSTGNAEAIGFSTRPEVTSSGNGTGNNGGQTGGSSDNNQGSGGGNNGGSSGGGTNSGSGGGRTVSRTTLLNNIAAGQNVHANLGDEALTVTGLGLTLKNSVDTALVNFRTVQNPEVAVSLQTPVYAYFEITHSVENDEISKGEIEFKIEDSWIEERKISREDVVLLRYNEENNGGVWQELSTTYRYAEGRYSYYSSSLPGLSLFAVSAKPSGEGSESSGFSIPNSWIMPLAIGLVVLVIVVIALIVVLRLLNKGRIGRGDKNSEDSVNINPGLLSKARNLVRQARRNGYSDRDIVLAFKGKGWSEKEIAFILKTS